MGSSTLLGLLVKCFLAYLNDDNNNNNNNNIDLYLNIIIITIVLYLLYGLHPLIISNQFNEVL